MNGQFSIEFVIDVSIILVLVIFLVVFFSTFGNTHYNAAVMNSLCTEIAQGINLAVSSNGFPVTQYIPAFNETPFNTYNISISNGIIIIFLESSGKTPSSLVSNTNVVSCGANTRDTANESFGLSNLAIYYNSTDVTAAYLYGNNTKDSFPTTVFGGGFPGATTLYLESTGRTPSVLAYEPSSFVYSNATLIDSLPPGQYEFYAQSEKNPQISVDLPFTKS
ncbi:MAG: hypothetical protein M1433_02825 [Candidatus Parvarchaeota archaeon]|nr:hypothetical protein [Candidatus Parvarchaeota archaeon]